MKSEELDAFLALQPFMSLQPSGEGIVVIEGDFSFTAVHQGHPQIQDSYAIRIVIPKTFPNALPDIWEIGNRVPRSADFHTHTKGTLCLGSNLNLMLRLQKEPTLSGYVSRCLVPHLYALSLKLKYGIPFIFGELKHGARGIFDDYQDLIGLKSVEQVLPALQCILLKKRIANKRPCPCGCGKRLGKCQLNEQVRYLRKAVPKSWLREHVTGK